VIVVICVSWQNLATVLNLEKKNLSSPRYQVWLVYEVSLIKTGERGGKGGVVMRLFGDRVRNDSR